MERVYVDGKVLNKRTADMLARWEFNALENFYVVQGSYNSGVSQSAGTHDGGGAVDLSVYGLGGLKRKKWVVKQGRLAGFAAWYRGTIPGLWNEHIHAIAIGDPELSSGARNQVSEYYAGGDGLVGSNRDPDPRVKINPWPGVPLKKVNALTLYRQFKKKNPKRKMSVKRVQWVLNEKLGTSLICDGVAGPQTRAAYKAWEKKVGSPSKDGVPGKHSLSKLGAGRFKASWTSYEKWRKSKNSKKRAAENEKKNPTFKNKV